MADRHINQQSWGGGGSGSSDYKFNGRLFIPEDSLVPNNDVRLDGHYALQNWRTPSTRNPYELYAGEHANGEPIGGVTLVSKMLTPNKLIIAFFSKQNVGRLHQTIIDRVFTQYNRVIARQADTDLQIIMRSMYLTYGKNNTTNIDKQVAELNGLVVAECLRIIGPNIQQHESFIRDLTLPVIPMPLPTNASIEGSKSYSLFSDVGGSIGQRFFI